jgi:transcriptional regulator with XRE-family HTH domain
MFDKLRFKKILEDALGDRKTTEYAEESGVNRTYLSKYLNLRLDSPPGPEIIKRLAEKAHNNVTYEDLMNAAGFLSDKSQAGNPQRKNREDVELEKEWDEIGSVLRRSGNKMTAVDKRRILRIIKAAIPADDDDETN